jgi:hypothetical protein
MPKQKISGYIMAGTGLIIILINAVSYIFGLDFKHPALTIMGLVFAVIGGKMIRQN